jgi:molecular chaperone GrpE
MGKKKGNLEEQDSAPENETHPGTEERESESPQPDSSLDTIEILRKEKEEQHDLLLRKQAEFENYRKRVAKEKDELRLTAQARVLEELLPVLDAFEKGLHSLKAAPGDSEVEAYREGYELMFKEVQSLLRKFAVIEIPGVGELFDPNVHEAVVREVTTGYKEGEILDEYRKGYTIKGRLLRPSQVKVAVHPAEPALAQEKGQGEEE